MITLVLLRHAKAVRDDPGGDHARSLSQEGRADAATAGEWLRRTLAGPVLVLASDARRTRETAELAFPAPRHDTEIRLEADLYGASVHDLLKRVHALDDTTVVLVGHNPGIGETARQLAGSGDDEALTRLRTGFPTSTAAVLRFDGAWTDVQPGTGHLIGLFLRSGNG